MIKNYFFMHKDKKLMAFSLSDSSVINKTVNKNTLNYLPYNYKDDIQSWLNHRGIPATRDELNRNLQGITPFELVLDNLCLSLTDCYWIKPVDLEFTWDSINLYKNKFRDNFSLDIINTKNQMNSIVGATNFIPSASLQGDLKKKWLIDSEGNRFLVKGNYSDGCIQSLSEVLATDIYKRQPMNLDYVSYSLIKISSNDKIVIGCSCLNYTTEDLEFVSAYDIISSFKCPNDMNYFQFYKKILKEHNIEADEFYDCEIMVDFLITNIDRHFNNFGVLRNSNNLQIIKPAPIFDSGNSMFYNSSYVPAGKELLDIDVNSFYKKESKLLSQVTNRGLIDIKYLPTDSEVLQLYSKDKTLSNEKLEKIVEAYKQKIIYLADFQNGKDIWSYPYRNHK